jgi:phosphoribosylcarboxyaminoimidazole (NCAIR) mutase
LAASILSINDTIIANSLKEWRENQTAAVADIPSEEI